MAKQLSKLNVGISGDASGFSRAIKRAESSAKEFQSKIKETGKKVLELSGFTAIAGGAIAGAFEVAKGYELSDQIENATIAFGAMTGSAESAETAMDAIKAYARNSSFEFPDLLTASRRLLAVGVSAQELGPILESAGEIAAGVGAPIDLITEALSRAAAEGKVEFREIHELGNQGVPIVAALARTMHVTADQVQNLANTGKIGFAQLEAAMASLSAPGGAFADIVEKQNATLGGSIHRLSTGIEFDMAQVWESFSGAFNIAGMVTNVLTALDDITFAATHAGEVFTMLGDRVTLALEGWAMPASVKASWEREEKDLEAKVGAQLNEMDERKKALAKAATLAAPKFPGGATTPADVALMIHPKLDLVRVGSAQAQLAQYLAKAAAPKIKPIQPASVKAKPTQLHPEHTGEAASHYDSPANAQSLHSYEAYQGKADDFDVAKTTTHGDQYGHAYASFANSDFFTDQAKRHAQSFADQQKQYQSRKESRAGMESDPAAAARAFGAQPRPVAAPGAVAAAKSGEKSAESNLVSAQTLKQILIYLRPFLQNQFSVASF